MSKRRSNPFLSWIPPRKRQRKKDREREKERARERERERERERKGVRGKIVKALVFFWRGRGGKGKGRT